MYTTKCTPWEGTRPFLHKERRRAAEFLGDFPEILTSDPAPPKQPHWDESLLRSQQLLIHLTRCFQRFMEPASSLPYSQESATGHYTQPDQSHPYNLHALLSGSCNMPRHLIFHYLIVLIICGEEHKLSSSSLCTTSSLLVQIFASLESRWENRSFSPERALPEFTLLLASSQNFRPQISELCYVFRENISYICNMIFSCILVMSTWTYFPLCLILHQPSLLALIVASVFLVMVFMLSLYKVLV
jgi:hypothetical protein